MWWECAECGDIVELTVEVVDRPPTCGECGTAGTFVPALDPARAGSGDLDSQRWFEIGYAGWPGGRPGDDVSVN